MELKHLQALLGIADTGQLLRRRRLHRHGAVQRLGPRGPAGARARRPAGRPGLGRLTEEGDVVIGRARQVMNELEAMVADVTALREEVVGTVRLGMIGTTGPLAGAPALRPAPGSPSPRPPQRRRGLECPAGAAAGLGPARPGRGDLPPERRRDHGGAALRRGPGPRAAAGTLPQPRSRRIPLERLSELELLLPAPGTALRAEIDSATGPARIVLRPAMELDGVRLIASLAFDGYGPAILPATAVPGHLRGRFSVLPVTGLPRRRVGVAQRRRGLPSAPARAVIDVSGSSSTTPCPCPRASTPPEPPGAARACAGSGPATAPTGRALQARRGCGSRHMVHIDGPSPGSGTSSTTSKPWRR